MIDEWKELIMNLMKKLRLGKTIAVLVSMSLLAGCGSKNKVTDDSEKKADKVETTEETTEAAPATGTDVTEADESQQILGKTRLLYRQLLIVIMAIACNSATLMGIILSAIVMAIWFIVAAFRLKRPSVLFLSLWTFIPHLVTGFLLLIFTGWSF